MQGTVGTAGGETEGQGMAGSVGVVSFGGVGVGTQFGKGRLGSDGTAGRVTAAGACPVPVWHWGLAVALTWSQAGLMT